MNFLKFKKILGFFLLVIAFVSIVYVYFSYKNQGVSNGNYEIDYYVKNTTWDTEEKKEVPYKKGDKLEYTFIVKNYDNFSKKIDLALDKIKEKLNMENLTITGNKSVSGDGASSIKISGKAKESGISSKDFNDIFDFKESSNSDSGNNDKENSNNTSVDKQEKQNQEIKNKTKEEQSKQQKKDQNQTNTGSTDINIIFQNDSFFSDIDNLIRIKGNSLDKVSSVGIGDESFNLFSKDGKYYIYVPKGSLDTGRYFTFAVKEDDTVVGMDKAVTFEYSDGDVVVLDIFPPKIKNDMDRWITVQGEGLENTVSIQLSNSNIFKDTTDYKVVSNNVLAVKIPSGLEPGKYYINVMTTDGIYKFENKTFEVY